MPDIINLVVHEEIDPNFPADPAECLDRRHQVWIATWYSGLYKYADGVFTNYLPDTVNIGSQSNSILHLTELPDGRLLCGTDHNAYIFDGQHFKLLDSGNHDLDRQITTSTQAITTSTGRSRPRSPDHGNGLHIQRHAVCRACR